VSSFDDVLMDTALVAYMWAFWHGYGGRFLAGHSSPVDLDLTPFSSRASFSIDGNLLSFKAPLLPPLSPPSSRGNHSFFSRRSPSADFEIPGAGGNIEFLVGLLYLRVARIYIPGMRVSRRAGVAATCDLTFHLRRPAWAR
jgi:hypothetical protein